MEIDNSLRVILAITVVAYFLVMYAIAIFASRRIHDAEDFVVAGRRLPLSLAWMTLLATWFGAGTMLVIPDEVRKDGLAAAGLDPFGAGFCLLLAGWLVAGPMWREKLLTVPDLFRRRFGPRAELMAALIMVPSYFGWIAAQFVALAGMANLFFGIDMAIGLLIVGVLGTGYTLLGGMWSVTLTDAIQVSLLLVGLIILGVTVALELGGLDVAWTRLIQETPGEKLQAIPRESVREFLAWLALFCTGALGNITGQDLMQRIFAARSERVASSACYVAGAMYLAFGLIPIFIGFAANLLMPGSEEESLLPAMAASFLHPVVAIVFLVALMSAVLSTIDSAILSPATVLAQNVVGRFFHAPMLVVNRWCVVLVAACSLVLAFVGESAYALLEDAYEITMVGLFVPMMIGLYTRPKNEWPGLASMLTGGGIWLFHYLMGWEVFMPLVPGMSKLELPVALSCTLCAFLAYVAVTAATGFSRKTRIENGPANGN